jgi:hypothetical protein
MRRMQGLSEGIKRIVGWSKMKGRINKLLLVGAALGLGANQCGCSAGSVAAAAARAWAMLGHHAQGTGAVCGREEGRRPIRPESTYLDVDETQKASNGDDKEGRGGATHGC